MRFLKKNEGITLVELMVSIAIGSMIMLAASAVLLLGLRVNHQTTEAVTQQYTARTVLTLMENLAYEGKIEMIARDPDGSWKIGETNDQGETFSKVILSYNANDKAIYTGEKRSGAVILENVVASYVIMEDNDVLTISLEDSENTYTSSVYCRDNYVSGGENFDDGDVTPGDTIEDNSGERQYFLKVLASQVGYRGGIIHHDKEPQNLNDDGTTGTIQCFCKDSIFYSEWYIGGFTDGSKAEGWSENTAWCACFISWGLSALKAENNIGGYNLLPQGRLQRIPGTTDEMKEKRWYADVDEFMAYFVEKQLEYETFKEQNKNTPDYEIWANEDVMPEPGDLIFFNTISSDVNNPSHVGAVLNVKKESDGQWYVTTIEGNSADMVAVRQYRLDDSDIIGYGDPWAAQAAAEAMDKGK